MRIFDKLRLRWNSLLRPKKADGALDAELRFHLDQLTDEYIESGMTPKNAREAALRAMGGMLRYSEECREMRNVHLLYDLARDFRHSLRALRNNLGFTSLAVLTLALGIGATASMFSVVYGVLLKPLPFEEPERLVALYHRGPGVNLPVMNQGPATWFTYLDHQRAFEGMGAWDTRELSVTGDGDPEHVEALAVNHQLLPLLGVDPAIGRNFEEADDRPHAPLRTILTYGYWQRKFGGENGIVGRQITVDGRLAEIVGVLPASFRFLRQKPALLLPLQLDRAEATTLSFDFQALARLKPGASIADANADISRMIPIVERVPGYSSLRLEANVRPLSADVIGGMGRVLWLLLGTVIIVLLIACANVANLLLARTEGRQREIAVRAALGAGRWRIARSLLAESVILALLSGCVSLLFAWGAIQLLRWVAPATLPRLEEIAIHPAVLAFTVGISLLSGLLFGLIPVLRLRTHDASALKEGGRSASDSRTRQRTRNALVVAEVALALVLLVASGLMIRTFLALAEVQPGFRDPEQIQTFRVNVPEAVAPDPAQIVRTHEQIAENLRRIPGVDSVGMASSITMDGEDNTNPLQVEHFEVPDGQMPPLRRFKSVAPGYYRTMGNPLIAGRDLTWADIHEERPVAILSENLAREYWGSAQQAIGKRVRGFRRVWYEVVGVVGNEHDDGLNQPATPMVYWPMRNQLYFRSTMAYAVKSTRVGTPALLREIQHAVWSVNPSLPLAAIQTVEEIESASLAQTSFAMVMIALAAGVALSLGIVGIYGVIAYVAMQRTREIGIRVALGAQTADVRRLFLRHGLVLTLLGIALGIGASLFVTRVMSSLLFGVEGLDATTYVAASAVLASVVMLATWLPARRAARIDPLAALRSE